MYKQKTDKAERKFTTIRIYVDDYDFLAKNVKYPEDMADTVKRLIAFARKKIKEKNE